ncbi:MAG: LysR family transcriptional regulator [Acidimicrobiales bacterium]
MMDLGHLRSFAEVAERGTIAAAATARDFTAPAVSQHLAKLEREIGTHLFDRAGRRLRLTDAGKALLPIALELLDLEARGRQVARSPQQRPRIVVAGLASAIDALVVPRLERLRPHLRLEIVESEDADALRDLRLGTVDLVLVQEYRGVRSLPGGTDRDPALTYTPLVTDRLRLVLPPDRSPTTTVADLGDADWLINGQGTRCAAATTQILETAGLRPTVAAVVADNTTLLALVSAGHGVTIVPELLLGRAPALTVADEELAIERTMFAVHRGTTTEPLARLLGEFAATRP